MWNQRTVINTPPPCLLQQRKWFQKKTTMRKILFQPSFLRTRKLHIWRTQRRPCRVFMTEKVRWLTHSTYSLQKYYVHASNVCSNEPFRWGTGVWVWRQRSWQLALQDKVGDLLGGGSCCWWMCESLSTLSHLCARQASCGRCLGPAAGCRGHAHRQEKRSSHPVLPGSLSDAGGQRAAAPRSRCGSPRRSYPAKTFRPHSPDASLNDVPSYFQSPASARRKTGKTRTTTTATTTPSSIEQALWRRRGRGEWKRRERLRSTRRLLNHW